MDRTKAYRILITVFSAVVFCLCSATLAVAAEGEVKWTYETSYPIGDSSPAISPDGTIYFVTKTDTLKGRLHAIKPDGTLKWDVPYPLNPTQSPAIGSDGTVYVASGDFQLFAIEPDDGSLKWYFQAGDSAYSSPAIGADGTIYFGSHDGNFYAVNPDGTLKWNRDVSILSQSPSPYSVAIGADGTIYGGSPCEKLYAIDSANGHIKWSVDHDRCYTYSSHSIGADGTIYASSEDGNLYAIAPNGSIEWTYEHGAIYADAPLIGADGTIYIPLGHPIDRLYAINPDGSLKWVSTTPAGGPMAIGKEGPLFTLTQVYGAWWLYALDPDDGSENWSVEIPEANSAYQPSIGSDGTVYFGANHNDLERYRLVAIDTTSGGLANSTWPRSQTAPNPAPDVTPPTVSATYPANGANDGAVYEAITATFDEPMDVSTINTNTFTVDNGVTGTVTYDTNTRTATFTPSAYLQRVTTYTVTITTGVADISGNHLAADYVWSFTTVSPDVTPPTVNSTGPADGAINVADNTTLTVTFAENEIMDASTINTNTITMDNGVTGSVTFDANTKTAAFTPSAHFQRLTTYTATITTGVADISGNNLAADYVFSFTTEPPDTTPPTVSSTYPIGGATGVSVNTTIIATFNESMDFSTINTSSFTLSNGVTGTVTYSPITLAATFTPSETLNMGTTYTATITTSVTDTSGNNMASNYSWSFTSENTGGGDGGVVGDGGGGGGDSSLLLPTGLVGHMF